MTEQEWLKNNQLSLDIWNKKYRVKDESFEEWLNRVSGNDEKVKELILNKKFLFGGRILSNRGTDRGAMSNCNSLGYIEDSLADIMQANTDLALTYKAQGGQGLSLSKIRPKGTLINNNFPSDGIVPFMEMFNITTKSISQGGNRRGALLIALDVWHKEALNFIKIKSNLNSINNANLSLEVDDKFMSIIENYYKTGEEPIVHIKRTYEGNEIEYDVEPVKLYKEICSYSNRYAEPGILFIDRMKKYNMAQNHSTYRIECTNACVSGDTLILTEDGYKKISDLVDKQVNIWNGYTWSLVTPKITGHNVPMFRVHLSNGNYLDCTDYHKWIIKDNSNRVETKDLKIGDIIEDFNYPVIDIDNYIGKNLIEDCYKEKDNTEEDKIFNMNEFPSVLCSLKERVNWLTSLIYLCGKVNNGYIQIKSTDKSYSINLQYFLNSLGCSCNIVNDGVIIPGYYASKLISLGLVINEKHVYDLTKPELQIIDIEKLEDAETVYCFNEPINHTGIFNGIMTGQCSEIPMTKHGACILGSINLGEYVTDPFTSSAKVDYAALIKDIPTVVRAMDDIVTENQPKHVLPGQAKVAETYRNVGIGIMGLNDLLVKLGLKYGEPESVALAGHIMKVIFRNCVLSSVALAKERGNFPGYESNIWDTDIIKNNFSEEEIIELKKEDHLRNLSLVSIAPTGSIGTMLSISTGAESYFALSFKRRTISLDGDKEHYYDVYVDTIQEYQKITGNSDIPSYFVGANDIPWKQRVDMQSSLQTGVDQAISSTVNLPKTTTNEDIEQLYLYAWKKGLKGITIYTDGSRDPILSTEEKKPDVIQPCGAPKRPKELPCEIYKTKVKSEIFAVCIGLYQNKPYEVFVFRLDDDVKINNNKGVIIKNKKEDYTLKSPDLNIPNLLETNISIEEKACTLYSSMLLRHGISLKYIIKISRKVDDNIVSFANAMCRILSKYLPKNSGEECPECGQELVRTGGCLSCPNCGYSRCE